ncbi:YafY family protein [Bacillus gobiensis]|uniref:helix-turn-helix transcriptional regulator n=1 Tax=Bacillus gobiensis TaxID=1441095 RepID=UPI003D1DDF02
MKLDRLLAIIVVLLGKRRIQAKELADIFEVSVRTIYRDIDTINQAGIPVITYQGTGGGIGIMDEYRIEKKWLTEDELAAIATALHSISSTYDSNHMRAALEKIRNLVKHDDESKFQAKTDKWFIDISTWGKDEKIKNKLQLLSEAIDSTHIVSFSYVNNKGMVSVRQAEPHTLVLKSRNWYLYAYCMEKEAFRFFKLMRMKDIQTSTVTFVRRKVELTDLPWDTEWNKPENLVELKIRVKDKGKRLAEEWFGVEAIQLNERGEMIITTAYPEDEGLYGFLLNFGTSIEVVRPLHIRKKLNELAKEIYHMYET